MHSNDYDPNLYRTKFKDFGNQWSNGMTEFVKEQIASMRENPKFSKMTNLKLEKLAKDKYKSTMIKKYNLLDQVPNEETKQEMIKTYNIDN